MGKIEELLKDKYKLRIPPTVYYDLLADVQELEEEEEPKFIAKSDGTIEQIKNCNDCLFKNEWEKIGKLLSVVLEKQTEQEPKPGHWINKQHLLSSCSAECSSCHERSNGYVFDNGFSLEYEYYDFCPKCGADMREVEE